MPDVRKNVRWALSRLEPNWRFRRALISIPSKSSVNLSVS